VPVSLPDGEMQEYYLVEVHEHPDYLYNQDLKVSQLTPYLINNRCCKLLRSRTDLPYGVAANSKAINILSSTIVIVYDLHEHWARMDKYFSVSEIDTCTQLCFEEAREYDGRPVHLCRCFPMIHCSRRTWLDITGLDLDQEHNTQASNIVSSLKGLSTMVWRVNKDK
jgi:hypothetical protein